MRLGYVILYVADVTAAVDFYEAAFGVSRRFVHDSGQYAEMETGATALAFAAETLVSGMVGDFRRNRADQAPAGAEVAFVVDDVASAYHKAVAAGATALVDPLEKPWGQTVAYVRDLNGVLVEICSPVAS